MGGRPSGRNLQTTPQAQVRMSSRTSSPPVAPPSFANADDLTEAAAAFCGGRADGTSVGSERSCSDVGSALGSSASDISFVAVEAPMRAGDEGAH